MNKKTLPGIIAVVAIVAIGTIVYMQSKTSTAPSSTDTPEVNVPENSDQTPVENQQLLPGTSNLINISDQEAGSSVVVDLVVFEKPGFIAVHEDNNGQPGKIVGTSFLVDAGTKQDVVIRAPVAAGKTYYAMLHLDDGDKKFDATKDAAAKDSLGNQIMMKFSVGQ
jgi:hypothetical protein